MREKITLLFIFILAISFISASQNSIGQENIEELAEKYNINLSSISEEDIQRIAEENNINYTNIADLESVIEKYNADSEDIDIDEVKKAAESIGINTTQINNILDGYIDSIGCQAFKIGSKNIIGQEIPNKIPYKNEIFNLYISKDFFASIKIYDGKISAFECDESLKQTYNIYIEEYSDLLDFANGFNIDTLNKKIKNEEIVVEGVGFFKKIKWFFSKIALRWFF